MPRTAIRGRSAGMTIERLCGQMRYLHGAPGQRLRFAAISGKTGGMKAALLPDRGVVKVAGDDARKFLNGLITSDIAKVDPAHAAFAALLTPQGKIISDFILAEAQPSDGGGYFLDSPRALAPTLVQRLNFYKLRAKVIVEDLSEVLGVMALWDATRTSANGLCYQDTLLPVLGLRCVIPPHLAS